MTQRQLHASNKIADDGEENSITSTKDVEADKRGLDVSEIGSLPLEKEVSVQLGRIEAVLQKIEFHLSLMTDEHINGGDL
jgi:hypothetical protein